MLRQLCNFHSPKELKKLELPNSQLQNIWVTLSSWIPGLKLCTASTRSYWMLLGSHPLSIFALFQVSILLSVTQQGTPLSSPLPYVKQKTIPKCPKFPGLSIPSLSGEYGGALRWTVSTHKGCLWKTHLGINRITALCPSSLQRLPGMRYRGKGLTEICRSL